ncbi:hypothetical protein TRICI_005461 [Trichomonascus ciferrii]|uniref:Small ribosomal subunit protein bS18m n=1 Tax=Trichomonascus ciferrii TaxID=44093 RepID=A0A642USL8_9ASCO|nr:hypothetical protein TRICI_005461 [Trichomonascus ciferrii]
MIARRLVGADAKEAFVRGFSTMRGGQLQNASAAEGDKRQHVRWSALSSAQPNSNNSQLKTSVKRMEELREKQSEEQTIDHSFVRQFQVGSTYDPFDFSMAKLRLERLERRNATPTDRFKELKMDPLKLWKHPQELSDYISDSGRILPGYLHGHKKKTQKRLAKAIRRARAAGLLSPVHKHVETLGS